MNYIILNGVKSTTIKGLMIQTLPPITKPKIRTQTEDIDGRDGDIVTKLGYSAYGKEFTIGLYGDYNVDDAIQYFDSSGEVVFSNELDKYYNYQIVDEIDFERLIRFKHAKVKMHVQPFKYDAVNRDFTLYNNLIELNNWSAKKYGISVDTSDSGGSSLLGTASSTVEFYIPIKPIILEDGDYTLSVYSLHQSEGCAIRLISGSPSDVNTFGGEYISLQDNETVKLDAHDGGTKKYDYIWLYIPSGTKVNCNLKITLASHKFDGLTVRNRGNIVSKPKVTIYGSGTVDLSVNGRRILEMNIDQSYITIDPSQMNAYCGNALKNRMVKGDYADLVLDVGENEISWTGNVTQVTVENYSRWI